MYISTGTIFALIILWWLYSNPAKAKAISELSTFLLVEISKGIWYIFEPLLTLISLVFSIFFLGMIIFEGDYLYILVLIPSVWIFWKRINAQILADDRERKHKEWFDKNKYKKPNVKN